MSDKILTLEETVEQVAALLDLPIAPAHKPGTIENFARLAEIAQLVMEFPLPAEVEAAPIFHP